MPFCWSSLTNTLSLARLHKPKCTDEHCTATTFCYTVHMKERFVSSVSSFLIPTVPIFPQTKIAPIFVNREMTGFYSCFVYIHRPNRPMQRWNGWTANNWRITPACKNYNAFPSYFGNLMKPHRLVSPQVLLQWCIALLCLKQPGVLVTQSIRTRDSRAHHKIMEIWGEK